MRRLSLKEEKSDLEVIGWHWLLADAGLGTKKDQSFESVARQNYSREWQPYDASCK